MRFILVALFYASIGECSLQAMEPKKYSLPLASDMIRADVYRGDSSPNVRAVLVLCPGYNENGSNLVAQREWQEYARTLNFGLLGLSFASEPTLFAQGRGYYYASQGSGALVLNGIRRIYGRDLPIFIYGFSGGAQFTSRFVEWKPERISSWCAYSAGWWDEPYPSKITPPGIVACGEEDERYGATLLYFLQGRAVNKPWTWISLSKIGHSPSGKLDQFVREYFQTVFGARYVHSPYGIWCDSSTQKIVTREEALAHPTLAIWLPNDSVADKWSALHHP